MSKLDGWHPNERACYLKHPVNGRVLQLIMSPANEQFLRELRVDAGYLPATAQDYRAQEDARLEKQKGVSA